MHTGTGFANGQMHTGTGSALVIIITLLSRCSDPRFQRDLCTTQAGRQLSHSDWLPCRLPRRIQYGRLPLGTHGSHTRCLHQWQLAGEYTQWVRYYVTTLLRYYVMTSVSFDI